MFEVEEATFSIMPIMAFCGKSGSGKTYSALLFARGYVGEQGNICVIDTEKGRSRAYAGRPEIGRFKLLQLHAPFTPERYVEAYRLACQTVGENGFVIIDSASHEWEGEGGICDMAEKETQALTARGKTASLNVWNKPKMKHKKFVNEFSAPSVPTILCLKMKTTLKPVKGSDPVEITDIVAEKNFRFEMTTVFEIEPNTHRVAVTKNPLPLQGITPQGFVITRETGKLYAEIIKSGATKQLDSLDEIQVKISQCDTVEELTAACTMYREQKHPQLTEIVNYFNQQKAIIEKMAEQEQALEQELTPQTVEA